MSYARLMLRLRWVGMLGTASAVLAACHRASTTSSLNPQLSVQSFGDTIGYDARILAFDPEREEATAQLRAPAYLVVLAVMPGRSIELIAPAPNAMVAALPAGRHTLSLQQYNEQLDNRLSELNAGDLREVNQCVRRRLAEQERQRERAPVKRDSTGKIIESARPAPTPAVDERRLEAACTSAVRASTRNRPVLRAAKREPGERYLVVLSSPFPIPATMLNERLETLLTSAPDVATTIEAIAQGLYAGFPGTWSGRYVAW